MSEQSVPPSTRDDWRRWSHVAFVSCAVVVLTLLALEGVWTAGPTGSFLAVVTGVLVLELVVVRRVIGTASREAGPQRLTMATWLTIFRAATLATLAGFLVVDQPTGVFAWLPPTLYAVAAGLDAADGKLARATDAVTELGARLDTEMDGLTVLVGATLVVSYGLAPVFFLAVGFARYGFVLGIWIRKNRGEPVFDLPDSRIRQLLGASAMLVIWLALLPVPGRGSSWLLATLVTIPFLLNFARDYLAVSGRL